MLVLILNQRLLQIPLYIVLIGRPFVLRIASTECLVLNLCFFFLLYLPCFDERIRAEVDEYLVYAPVLPGDLELDPGLQAFDEVRIDFFEEPPGGELLGIYQVVLVKSLLQDLNQLGL